MRPNGEKAGDRGIRIQERRQVTETEGEMVGDRDLMERRQGTEAYAYKREDR